MNGVLLIDKPAGMTSHDVVARVRKIIGERRVGHTGTLDPFATGLLVILIGRATRLAQFLSGADKEYEAVIRLGYSTDTGDRTGTRIEPKFRATARLSVQNISEEEIEDALASLRGDIDQLPPMFSAKKIAGRKLYEHARRGEEVARQPIRVRIHKLETLETDGESLVANVDGCADLRIHTLCSAGTYVRALAEDFGKKLGVGAHLAELRRTRAGRFTIENAITLDELAGVGESGSIDQNLISPNEALSELPSIQVDEVQAQRTIHGSDLQIGPGSEHWNDGTAVRIVSGEELIAIGKFDAQRQAIHPAVVFTGA